FGDGKQYEPYYCYFQLLHLQTFYQYPTFMYFLFAAQMGRYQVIVRTFRKALATPIVLVVVAPVHLVAPPVNDGHLDAVEAFTTDDLKLIVPTIPVGRKHVRDFEWVHHGYRYRCHRAIIGIQLFTDLVR